MHDVVAHSMSVMVVQAGGARRILDRDPARALEAAPADRAHRAARRWPRCATCSACCSRGRARARSRRSRRWPSSTSSSSAPARPGLPAALHSDGERRALPAGLDLAAYRIVQEALTNALKHAAGRAHAR